MSAWLTPLEATLEAIESPCPFFFRDDDAGWDDTALMALLDEFEAAGVTVDVAAIPQALTPDAGRLLAARLGRLPSRPSTSVPGERGWRKF